MRYGFTVDLNKKVWVDDTIYQKIVENTWIIRPENIGKSPDKFPELFGNNARIIPEKSQNNLGKNARISPELLEKMSEKILEKPSKMIVNRPEKSDNYDANTLEYCCKILEHLVVSDGASIKLTNLGLILKSNPTYPQFRLKYCPNCGTEIEQNAPDYVEKPVPEPKKIRRDNMKVKRTKMF